MAENIYRLTDQANVELRRRAPGGKIKLSDRAAQYELARGTVELDSDAVVQPKAAAKSSGD